MLDLACFAARYQLLRPKNMKIDALYRKVEPLDFIPMLNLILASVYSSVPAGSYLGMLCAWIVHGKVVGRLWYPQDA